MFRDKIKVLVEINRYERVNNDPTQRSSKIREDDLAWV